MAIQISSGFKIGSTEPIDSRLVLTKREMVAMKDTLMPESYISICKDDHRVYSYNKSNKFNTETGKFRILESIIKGYYNDGEFYEDGGLTILSPKSLDTIYVDLDSNITYVYRPSAGTSIYFYPTSSSNTGVNQATDKVAGILKIYSDLGANEDGTISQKVITKLLSQIKFATETIKVDDKEEECLVLVNPAQNYFND